MKHIDLQRRSPADGLQQRIISTAQASWSTADDHKGVRKAFAVHTVNPAGHQFPRCTPSAVQQHLCIDACGACLHARGHWFQQHMVIAGRTQLH